MSTKPIRQRLLFYLLSALLLLILPVPVPAQESSGDSALKQEDPAKPQVCDLPVQTNEISGWPQGPSVWAETAVVLDLDSGTILYAKDMDGVRYPASITKIMTVLLALENSSLNERVVFSEHAIFGIERDSSHIGIRVGEILSMEDCLYGMMLESANEVCLAVAEHISGSEEAFVELMNQKAAQLGCTNTHFTNPNGLPDENHYTTAHDMALIARAAYRYPLFRKICQTQIYTISKTNLCGEERWLNNHHKMLPDGLYRYEGCTGGKTGFTQAALNTLVTYAERDGRRLVCVSLRTNGSQIYADTAALLDYGFQNFQNITLYSQDSCVTADSLYPTLYFGGLSSLDHLRSTCVATVPLNTDSSRLTVNGSLEESTVTRSYQYSGYSVAREAVSAGPIRALLTGTPKEAGVACAPYTPSLIDELSDAPALRQTSRVIRRLPVIAYLLLGVLVLLIVMELSLALKKARRKKSRKKSRRKK